jgi:hypothetical protein
VPLEEGGEASVFSPAVAAVLTGQHSSLGFIGSTGLLKITEYLDLIALRAHIIAYG